MLVRVTAARPLTRPVRNMTAPISRALLYMTSQMAPSKVISAERMNTSGPPTSCLVCSWFSRWRRASTRPNGRPQYMSRPIAASVKPARAATSRRTWTMVRIHRTSRPVPITISETPPAYTTSHRLTGPTSPHNTTTSLATGPDDARQHPHHQRGAPSARYHAAHARRERIGGPCEQEHLGQVPALETARTAHAHLRAPLGGEHDEDQEDQQHANGDREEADSKQRYGDEQAACLGEGDRVRLVGGVVVEVEPAGNVVVAAQLRGVDGRNRLTELCLQVGAADDGLELGCHVRTLDFREQVSDGGPHGVAFGQRQREQRERALDRRPAQKRLELGGGGAIDLQDSDEQDEVVLCSARGLRPPGRGR